MLFSVFFILFGCQSAPQKAEIELPVTPKMPVVIATKTDGGVFIQEADFIALTRYIEKMKGHVQELKVCIGYYKGELKWSESERTGSQN